jgi:UDP:flavonoid glycosyltransferase YjiC (YdhE family)
MVRGSAPARDRSGRRGVLKPDARHHSIDPDHHSIDPDHHSIDPAHHPIDPAHHPIGERRPPVAKIAVVAGPDAGHALPALGVAVALRAHGNAVRFFTGEGHDATAMAHGLRAERLPLLAPTVEDDDLGHRLWSRAASMAGPLADTLQAWGPQLIVVDTLTRCGAFAAQLLGVPWVELIPHHLDDPAEDLPPVGLGRRPARSAVRRADDRRIVGLQRRSLAVGASQAARAAAGIGLAHAAPAALRLVGTLPGLERPRASWPADAHVVGPLALDPVMPALTVPPGDLPLVVVTDSTATGVDRQLGAVAVRALARMDLRVVVTSALLPAQQRRGLTVGRGPHVPLLAQAALAVGFGGAGFVSKAAAAGVPMVVIPLQGDQREGAARLREAGAGRVLPLRSLRPSRLRWSVIRQLADPDASIAARRLSVEAAQLGPDLAARLVEDVLHGSLADASGPRCHLRRDVVQDRVAAPS